VLGFLAEQRSPRGDGRVVRLADGEAGLSARTIKRRLASVSGFFGYLTIIGVVASNPVPRVPPAARVVQAGSDSKALDSRQDLAERQPQC
jgi:site-specific recombinase XerC